MKVSVSIEEGERFTVGSIDMAGDETVDKEVLRGLLQLEEGDWFNRSALTDDVTTLTEHYTDRGFYFASVQPLSNLDEDDKRVDVVFELRKGPLYFVRNVEIAGNTTTVDPVIRREIPIVEGQLYSQRAINIARARIRNLGFFEGGRLPGRAHRSGEPDRSRALARGEADRFAELRRGLLVPGLPGRPGLPGTDESLRARLFGEPLAGHPAAAPSASSSASRIRTSSARTSAWGRRSSARR